MTQESSRERIERLGKYRIAEELGRGGMARVFKGHDEETGDVVAIKVLLPELTAQPAFIQRFKREIETLRTVQDPSIVSILDVGQEGHYHYYVMEYMDGESLEQIMRRGGALSVADSLRYTRAVAHALQSAHVSGIIHRDIKPANIMTDSAGNVKLADFGIAKDVDATRLTVTGGIVGTADYMSPEQAEGRRVTRKSDIYSLGVVLYQMLTGKVPFVGKTYMDVIRAHRFSLAESPKLLKPSIPGRISKLVESMMEKDPNKRPASGLELISRIDAIEGVQTSLTDEEHDAARDMIRSALLPAADWKAYAIKIGLVMILVGATLFAAWGAKGRYFTTPAQKLAAGMEAFQQRDFKKAGDLFKRVIYFHEESPEAKKAQQMIALVRLITSEKTETKKKPVAAPDAVALYDSALRLLEKGQRKEAVKQLKLLAEEFPDTEGGGKAAAKLFELGEPFSDSSASGEASDRQAPPAEGAPAPSPRSGSPQGAEEGSET